MYFASHSFADLEQFCALIVNYVFLKRIVHFVGEQVFIVNFLLNFFQAFRFFSFPCDMHNKTGIFKIGVRYRLQQFKIFKFLNQETIWETREI